MDMQTLTEKYLGRGKGWEYRYGVRGTWPFPVDMLRYDQCAGATEDDKAAIARLSSDNAEGIEDLRRPVQIQLVGSVKPTERRWRSFCWRVL
jgi:hypothetical protein